MPQQTGDELLNTECFYVVHVASGILRGYTFYTGVVRRNFPPSIRASQSVEVFYLCPSSEKTEGCK